MVGGWDWGVCPEKVPWSFKNPPCCVLAKTLESDFFSHLVVIVSGMFCLDFLFFFFFKVHGYLQNKDLFYCVILKCMPLLQGMRGFFRLSLEP